MYLFLTSLSPNCDFVWPLVRSMKTGIVLKQMMFFELYGILRDPVLSILNNDER